MQMGRLEICVVAMGAMVLVCCGDDDDDKSSDGTKSGCFSNAQCAYPTPLCSFDGGGCVECLAPRDCGHAPGTVCSLGACVCPDGGTTCEPGPAPDCVSNTDCGYPTAVCDQSAGVCVECLVVSDCLHMPSTVCSLGACVCPGGDTYCGPGLCADLTSDIDHCGFCGHRCYDSCGASMCASPWEPISDHNAPVARARHVAVWTGSAMVVWGGSTGTTTGNNLGGGGVYDLQTSRWTATSMVDAPSPRQRATAVWTGSRMIIWGGRDGANMLADGASYDPVANTWTRLSTVAAPPARADHTAVWTGSSMIIWGGKDAVNELNSGGTYDPIADTWTATPSNPAPAESRSLHSAVWAGAQMWTYGGFGDAGATVNVRFPNSGVNGGSSFEPQVGWTVLSAAGEPSARDQHTAVWDGTRMLIFGGFSGATAMASGGRYAAGTWSAMAVGGPGARYGHCAVWLESSSVMVVWGGRDDNGALGTGAVYDPSADSWTTPTPTVLDARFAHTAVSTGDRMLVWGGVDAGNQTLADGGVYTP